jgi:hypothetical protein
MTNEVMRVNILCNLVDDSISMLGLTGHNATLFNVFLELLFEDNPFSSLGLK